MSDAAPVDAAPLPLGLLPDTASVEDGRLWIGGVELTELAERFGTPLFVYDEAHLRSRCREARRGVRSRRRDLRHQGLPVSGHGPPRPRGGAATRRGDRRRARGGPRGGGPAADLVLHGNNKSIAELDRALEVGVGRIVVDSDDELDRIEALVAAGRARPSVLVRINPGIEVHTHEHVRTGNLDSKFGFPLPTGQADAAVRRARDSAAMELVGLHLHIGSQVFSVENFLEGLAAVTPFVTEQDLPELVVGGGLGVAYVAGEEAPTHHRVGRRGGRVVPRRRHRPPRIAAEPGRAIVAAAAVTLYTVGTVKDIPGVRTYVAVDGGMSDNPRPVLYGSGYETFLPAAADAPT